MDGYIGEIRGFAGTFNPMNWAICQGQTLSINQYTALFSIIGVTYGGNGTTNFMLPDLRGRVPVSAGLGTGLTKNWGLGEYYGTETTQLTIANLPVHTHAATTSSMSVTGTATGSISPRCLNDAGGVNTPAGNVMGTATGAYAAAGDADSDMASITANLTLNGSVSGSVTVGNTGGSQAFINIQPVLAINWIICLNGMFPTRD